MDVLADVLTVSSVHGTVGAQIEAGTDWGWWNAPTPGAAIHAVTSGSAWLLAGDAPPLELVAGDVVLLPRGAAHVLASDPRAAARTGPEAFDRCEHLPDGRVRIGTGTARTHILCAHYERDPAVSLPVLDVLPDLTHVRSEDRDMPLAGTVGLLAHEMTHPGPAGAVVLDRLVDVLLVQMLRAWMADRPAPTGPSWLAALTDPVVSSAMAAMHAEPARGWTTAMLAREIAVSRTTLTRRFAAAADISPGAYLTRWRMDLAAQRLRDTDASLEEIARSIGYTSPYAFSRAFRRAHGLAPGRYRSIAREERREPRDPSGGIIAT